MKLIVGLGNPGKEYENTRHNIGFMALDNYLKDASWQRALDYYLKDTSWQKKFNALYTTEIINNEKVIFVKPETYMNLSGNSVIEFVNFYKIKPQDILVIHDDLDLPFGKVRVKINSSAGGHNGIKSIIERLGNNNFARLKIGISHNTNGDTKDFVLGKFNKEQLTELEKVFFLTNKIIDSFIEYDINKVMNDYNGAGKNGLS